MKRSLVAIALSALAWPPLHAQDAPLIPRGGTFTTLAATPLPIEGLTGDRDGNFYAGGRTAGAGVACPIWRMSPASPTPVVVGRIPASSAEAQCSPAGITFGADGRLYVTDGDKIYGVRPDATEPPLATLYATGVAGANGIAFDSRGTLWVSDGGTGVGRLWKVAPGGGAGVEAFRVQPMANPAGVGREARGLPPGTAQAIVANGVAFDRRGDMFVADTARGALWRVQFDDAGNLQSPTGCDTTFTANTLCLSNVFAAHPLLDGADGIALDAIGNVWVAPNERNAVVVVTRNGSVVEPFRNPVDTTGLRNAGPLEFPTSPFLSGDLLCITSSDGGRRDNAPNTAGELGGPGLPRGKVSCWSERLPVPGLPLPVRMR